MDADYELFAAVGRARSLSDAGRALGISPAMVSKRLARLEARLGVQLVHRTTRRLALTPAGERFHRDIVAVLDAARDAEERVVGRQGVLAGTLRISAPTSFARLHLAPFLKPFLDSHPHLSLDLHLSDGFADLLGERIDVAIRIAAEVEPGLDATRLATSQRVLCAAPPYLTEAGTPARMAELSRHRLLAATGQLPWRLVSPRGVFVVEGESHVRTNSSEVARELAMAGVGIAFRSLWDVGRELREGRLIRILPDWQGSASVGIFAVRPRGAIPAPAVEAFVRFLTGLYADPPWERG